MAEIQVGYSAYVNKFSVFFIWVILAINTLKNTLKIRWKYAGIQREEWP